MSGSLVGLVALCGALLAGGMALVVAGTRRVPVRLGDALASLDGEAPASGRWRTRVPLLPGQERALALAGVTPQEHAGEKVLLALVGAAVPGVVGATAVFALGVGPGIPVGAAVVGAVVGFFVPDLLLRRREPDVRADASEALFTFFDLVTLERLSNASASQALASAASMSDVPLFTAIRDALDRARLEQRPPWAELKRLADELGLPELADIADVMRLDEHGASLAGTLRARVGELRDAHLNQQKVAAHALNERLTVWMVLPAIVFALAFLAPPLLRLVGIG